MIGPMRRAALLLALGVLGCGPKTLQQRLASSERLATDAEAALAAAEVALDAVDPDQAEAALRDARKLLERPDASLYPEHDLLLDRLKADEARAPPVRAVKEKKDLEAKVELRRKALAAIVARYQQAFDRLIAKDLQKEDLEAFDAAAKELERALEHDELVAKSEAWAAEVQERKELLERGAARTGTARARVAFLTGPGMAGSDGKWLLEQARIDLDAATRLKHQREAVAKLTECANAKALIDRTQALTVSTVQLQGRFVTPTAWVKSCAQDLAGATKTLRKLEKAAGNGR